MTVTIIQPERNPLLYCT